MNRTPRPSRRSRRVLASVTSLVASFAAVASAQQTNNPFTSGITPGVTVRIGDFANIPNSPNGQFARMNDAITSPDGRLFITDQRGPVYSVSQGGAPTSYLNVGSFSLGLIEDAERGVGSVAFHPQFTQTGTPGFGKMYAAFSTQQTSPTPDYQIVGESRNHDEVVYEFSTANPLAPTFTPNAVPRQVLRIAKPRGNHNGGGLGFNPNAAVGTSDYGALYYSMGDGGGGGDEFNQGQNDNALLGKILRINPLDPDAAGSARYSVIADNAFAADGDANTRGEIYATGFRNPQRFRWDAAGAKKMYVGDIGQGVVEEIDVVVNGGDYGWGDREGSFRYVNGGNVEFSSTPTGQIRPIVEYDHGEGVAVTGGVVYRGNAIPTLTGKYVFGDLESGRIFYVDADTTANPDVDAYNTSLRELFLTEDGVTTRTLQQLINDTSPRPRSDLRLGQDVFGNILVLNKSDGVARMLLPAVVPEPTTLAALAAASTLALRRRR